MVALEDGIIRRRAKASQQLVRKWGWKFWTLYFGSIIISMPLMFFLFFMVDSYWGSVFVLIFLPILVFNTFLIRLEYGEEAMNLEPIDVTKGDLVFRRYAQRSDALLPIYISIPLSDIVGQEVEVVDEWYNGVALQTSYGSRAWILHLRMQSGGESLIVRHPYYIIETANFVHGHLKARQSVLA